MYNYTELTFTELVTKIGKSRFFHLPKMLEEILGRLVPQEPKYKVYTALLNQSGTDAPVATVLENTLGNIVWSYDDIGSYIATSDSLFGNHKGGFTQDTNVCFRRVTFINDSILNLATLSPSTSFTDGLLTDALIEIRVYN